MLKAHQDLPLFGISEKQIPNLLICPLPKSRKIVDLQGGQLFNVWVNERL